jgi:4'-phosphopantetheinyl transferase
MEVYWLEQRGADVPASDDWLSAAETSRLSRIRFEKRRADWRLGRWTIKMATSMYLGLPRPSDSFRNVEVRPEPLGAPVVWLGDRPAPVTISLSHRDGVAVCAIASPGVELGCDLEMSEPRSAAFLADYFTPGERSFIEQPPAGEQPQRMALLWSAKESALKALRVGLRIDTREVVASVLDTPPEARAADRWRPLHVACRRRSFDGWWRPVPGGVHTVVGAPALGAPSRLDGG